jgi:hypothetical protein
MVRDISAQKNKICYVNFRLWILLLTASLFAAGCGTQHNPAPTATVSMPLETVASATTENGNIYPNTHGECDNVTRTN